MSYGPQVFVDKFGPPEPLLANGIHFSEEWANMLWEGVVQEVGTGYFMDQFLCLFGEGIREFDPLIESWAFLLPDEKERWVIGKNAYGALLLLEDPTVEGTMGLVGLLDPLTVSYQQDNQLDLMGLVGNWLPQERQPKFLDDNIYQEWRSQGSQELESQQILAIKQPLSLEGKMELANFQVENIFDYYQSTAEIYKKYLNHDTNPSETN
ncbi:MAG: hypothetical protein AAF433_14335 [Bacteroidota bacterium]